MQNGLVRALRWSDLLFFSFLCSMACLPIYSFIPAACAPLPHPAELVLTPRYLTCPSRLQHYIVNMMR